jgi:hypothetical protein
MRNTLTSLIVLSCLLAFAPSVRADQVDNPIYQAWAKFNIGSNETLDGTVSGQGFNMTFEYQYVLSEKADDHVTLMITTTMSVMGQQHTNSRSQTIAAKVDSIKAQQIGEDKVDAAGKTWDCKVWNIPDMANQSTTVKVWAADALPGGIVKMDATTPRGNVEFLLKSYEAK